MGSGMDRGCVWLFLGLAMASVLGVLIILWYDKKRRPFLGNSAINTLPQQRMNTEKLLQAAFSAWFRAKAI
jgi:hypothetical protein